MSWPSCSNQTKLDGFSVSVSFSTLLFMIRSPVLLAVVSPRSPFPACPLHWSQRPDLAVPHPQLEEPSVAIVHRLAQAQGNPGRLLSGFNSGWNDRCHFRYRSIVAYITRGHS